MVYVMYCPNCGKESNNLRMCAFCQKPYPDNGVGQAGMSASQQAAAAVRRQKAGRSTGPIDNLLNAIAGVSRAKRWGAAALLVLLIAGYCYQERSRAIQVGVVLPNLIGARMSPSVAADLLKSANLTATVEARNGVLRVQFATATFPERLDGQLALAQQYARADLIVLGRKRAIDFRDPAGSEFAKSDPHAGVRITR